MTPTRRANLQRVIKAKLEGLGFTIDIFSPNDRADLIGYDTGGTYIAIKLNDDNNIYKESKQGAKFILCTSLDQFISLLTNKKPLSQQMPENLFNP